MKQNFKAFTDNISLSIGRKLPIILQTEATECGLACLAMITSYHGYHTDLVEMRRRFGVSLKGSTLKQIMQSAQQMGMGTRAVKAQLQDLVKLRTPAMLHWNFNHFVVLKDATSKKVVIHDPAHGLRTMTYEEASKHYTGVALEVWPETSFEKQASKPRLKIMSLMGKVSGFYRSLIQVLLLAFALEVFSLVSPFFLQWTIDNVIVSKDYGLLTTLVIGFGLLLLMQQAVSLIRAWVMMHLSTMINVQWRANLFTHLLKLPVNYFEKRHLGDVVSRFKSIDAIQTTLTSAFINGILDGIMTIATLIMMFIYSPWLALIAVVAMTLYGLGRWAWYQPLKTATEEEIIHAARQDSHFLETVRGVRTIKLFQRQDERRSNWLTLLVEQINAGLRTDKLSIYYQQMNGLLFGIENLLVIYFGAQMVMDGQFTVGALMAFNAYKGQFDSRVGSLIDKIFELKMLQLQGERLSDIVLHAPEKTESRMDADVLRTQAISLEVKNLHYRYSDQEPFVLDGVNFKINPGESVAIIGPSGCGKSTLINVLLGILPPTEGSILVSDIDIDHLGIDSFRSVVGTVMQDDVLFAGSIMDNVSFFDSNVDMDWVVECTQMASVHAEVISMPMGYNTLVGDMGTVLSGGQKQRILLARALYKKPRLLFLDEATSHLDVECEFRVNEAIKSLKMTRIMVAHRPETIASADRVIMISEGKVGLDETTAKLSAKNLTASAKQLEQIEEPSKGYRQTI